jgi:hypothetical protein
VIHYANQPTPASDVKQNLRQVRRERHHTSGWSIQQHAHASIVSDLDRKYRNATAS